MKQLLKIIVGMILTYLIVGASMAKAAGRWDCTECSADNQRTCLYVIPDPVEGEKIIRETRQSCPVGAQKARDEISPNQRVVNEKRASYYCESTPNRARRWSGDSHRCRTVGHIVLLGAGCNHEYYEDIGETVRLRDAQNASFSASMASLDICEAQAAKLNGK